MKKSSSFNWRYVIYFLLIFCAAFQDLPFGIVFGEFARTPCGALSLLIFIPICFKKGFSFDLKNRRIKWIKIALLIYLLINIIFLILYTPNSSLGNETILSKTIKGSLYVWAALAYVYDLWFLGKCLSRKQKLFPFVALFFFLFAVLVVEYFNHHAFDFLHCNKDYGERIRLLCPEASYTSPLILVSFFCTFYYFISLKRKAFMGMLICALFAIQLYFSGSKSLLTSIGIIVLLFLIFYKGITKNIKCSLICALVILSFCFFPSFKKMFLADIQQFTSFSTRLFTIYCSLIFGLIFPFGVGAAAYLKYFPELMRNVYPSFSKTFNFNMSEILQIMNSTTDEAVAVKGGWGQLVVCFGLFGTFMIFYSLIILFRIANRRKEWLPSLLVLAIVIALLFVNFDIKYELFAALGLSVLLCSQNDEKIVAYVLPFIGCLENGEANIKIKVIHR